MLGGDEGATGKQLVLFQEDSPGDSDLAVLLSPPSPPLPLKSLAQLGEVF